MFFKAKLNFGNKTEEQHQQQIQTNAHDATTKHNAKTENNKPKHNTQQKFQGLLRRFGSLFWFCSIVPYKIEM
jgi:hypothetical protein